MSVPCPILLCVVSFAPQTICKRAADELQSHVFLSVLRRLLRVKAHAVVRHGDFRAKQRFSGHKRHRAAILFASDAPFHGVFDKRLNRQRG